jgi:hypothetical protein
VAHSQVWPHRPIAFDFDSLRLRLTKQDLQMRILAEMNNHYASTGTPPDRLPTGALVACGLCVCGCWSVTTPLPRASVSKQGHRQLSNVIVSRLCSSRAVWHVCACCF